MNIPIVCNHSIRMFNNSAAEIAEGIRKCGHTPLLFDNFSMMKTVCDEENFYEKSVFLDKDIMLGLRMEIAGIRLYNNIGSIEMCDDKRRTYEMLKNDFSLPDTEIYPLAYFPSEEFFESYASYIEQQFGLPCVAKLAFGSQGKQVTLITSHEKLVKFQTEYYSVPHLYQKYIKSSKGRDLRVYVVDGKTEAAMIRLNENDFRSNIALGGKAEKYSPTDSIKELCEDCTQLLGLDFAGVDILFDEHGDPLICEVNSNALFDTIDEVCGVKIGHRIAECVCADSNASSAAFSSFQ